MRNELGHGGHVYKTESEGRCGVAVLVHRFYVVLVSALEQTRGAPVTRDSQWVSVALIFIYFMVHLCVCVCVCVCVCFKVTTDNYKLIKFNR